MEFSPRTEYKVILLSSVVYTWETLRKEGGNFDIHNSTFDNKIIYDLKNPYLLRNKSFDETLL